MGKLQHLMPEPGSPLGGFIDFAIADLAKQVAGIIQPEINAKHSEIESMRVQLARLTPELKQALGQYLASVVAQLQQDVRSNTAEVRGMSGDLGELQGRLVAALSQVKIPDYSAQLARLESKAVDLGPVLERLDAMAQEEEEEPKKWVFNIERDERGLISNVTAEAAE